MKSLKTYTVEQITRKLERYCAYQERCHQDIEKKLRDFKVIPEVREHIILHLLKHDFLNEERFAKSFARGKFRIKKWGKVRITRELKIRDISVYNIKSALKEITDEEYSTTFNELAQRRCSGISEENIFTKRKKLADYLLYRGWESDLVYKKITELIN